MKSLREYIKESENKGIAIGHFNVSNIETLHGIYNAARKLNVPVIIGVSEKEENFIGRKEISTLIKEFRKRDNFPIFLNADHHYTFESVRNSINDNFDAIIIDKADVSLEENISITKECVYFAKKLKEETGRDVLVEGELGFIGKSSMILEKIPDGVNESTMTDPQDAKYFVEETGVDMLAPSVGNIHGMVKGGNPKLDIERIKKIRQACGVPLVLHGGSGISDEDFREAIKAGISIIHINTEIRIAYKQALEKFLKENPNEIAPYKFSEEAVEAVERVVFDRLKLFNNI
jgi:fructose-bisphosphate aldolase class II